MSINNSKDRFEKMRRVALEIIVRHSRPARLVERGSVYHTVYPSVGVRLVEQELRRLGYTKHGCVAALESLRDWKVISISGPSKRQQVQLS